MIDKITDSCTGCRTCEKVCSKNCISMKPDMEGFLIATIDSNKCVDCGLCKKYCPQNTIIVNKSPLEVYAIRTKDNKLLKRSSSGGIFAAVAKLVLDGGGVVFGAAYNNNMQVEHVCINSSSELWRLQSSKYVQSNTKNTYVEAKEMLEKGLYVLYSGTPCQIAGLNSYLKRKYDNLITIDIVCHGVPSPKIFAKYIEWKSKEFGAPLQYCNFRDKADGWGQTLTFMTTSPTCKKQSIIGPSDPYYYHFLQGNLHRKCCYNCLYASKYRPADMTIGDYWGIEREHKKLFSYKGVSLLMLNNQQTVDFFRKIKNDFIYEKSTYEKASRRNYNLKYPSKKGNKRDIIYKRIDELTVEEYFNGLSCPQTIKNRIKAIIPSKIRLFIKILKTYACRC